jgi:hypothetical protein
MIVYPFTCGAGHAFEGWYASSEAYAKQRDAGHVECPVCGTHEVRKLPSAPYVHTSAPMPAPVRVVTPAQRAVAIAQLKSMILAGTEDVGRKFATVARRMHQGEEEERGIRGRVTPAEAAELQEEGIAAVAVPPEIALDELPH